MSFFKTKQIQHTVRGQLLNFNVISKSEMENLRYYGKVTNDDIRNDPELVKCASNEMMSLLAFKIISKEGENGPTAEELNELTNDEIQEIIIKVSGSSETLKQQLNKR